jgi:hypothetical protein
VLDSGTYLRTDTSQQSETSKAGDGLTMKVASSHVEGNVMMKYASPSGQGRDMREGNLDKILSLLERDGSEPR